MRIFQAGNRGVMAEIFSFSLKIAKFRYLSSFFPIRVEDAAHVVAEKVSKPLTSKFKKLFWMCEVPNLRA